MNSFYTWNDQVYCNLMVQLFSSMEPRCEQADTILFRDLDEVTEVSFFTKGIVKIGFEINNK